MLVVFLFIGFSFIASLLCLFLPPTFPGIASMAASFLAALSYTVVRLRKRAGKAKIVKVDGVTLDSRREEGSGIESDIAEELHFRLETEEKRAAALEADLHRANQEGTRRASCIDNMKSAIEKIASPAKASESEERMKAVISNLDRTRRISEGFRENIVRLSERLSATCDEVKKRRVRGTVMDTQAVMDEHNSLSVMASTLEELYERSNVIAVNGAIEAARLGKEGKGFSVIAGEMQAFAGETKELADEFRAFDASQSERQKWDEEKTASLIERERELGEAVDRAVAITVDLSEDINRLTATGVADELDTVADLLETEIENQKMIFDQLTDLLEDTE